MIGASFILGEAKETLPKLLGRQELNPIMLVVMAMF